MTDKKTDRRRPILTRWHVPFRTEVVRLGGRPPTPPADALSATLRVRLREQDHAIIEAAAAAAGTTVSDWARRVVVRAARRAQARSARQPKRRP